MTINDHIIVSKKDLPSLHEGFLFLETDAVRIGDVIVNQAEALLGPNEKRSKDALSFSDGASGIILFLLALYRHTRNPNYLAAAHIGVASLCDQKNERAPLDYSFFKGALGVAYTLLQFHKATGDQNILDKALAIAKKCADKYLYYEYTSNFLSNGRSGSLLVLLHIYSVTHEKTLLDLINLFVNKIIQDASHGNLGLHWRSFNSNSRGKCGLLQGSSGIAYAFLELGYYFKNDTFYEIARQAFAFEDFHWDPALENWPNCTQDISSGYEFIDQKSRLHAGNLKSFEKTYSTITYARGAAGIGLARSKAFQRLGDSSFSNDVENAFQIMKRQYRENDTPSILDGAVGCAMFGLEAYRATTNSKYLDFSMEVAMNVHRHTEFEKLQMHGRSEEQPDFSLFKGVAGIGYLNLQLIDPMNTPSVALPALDTTIDQNLQVDFYPFIDLSSTELKRILLRKVFGRTIWLIENLAMYQLKRHLERTSTNPDGKIEFQIFVKNLIPQLDQKHGQVVKSIFDLELKKIDMCNSIKNGALMHMQEVIDVEKLETLFKLEDTKFQELCVAVSDKVAIVSTICNPQLNTNFALPEDLNVGDSQHQTLLKPTAQCFFNTELRKTSQNYRANLNTDSVLEIQLKEIQWLLVSTLTFPKQVKNVVLEMALLLDLPGEQHAAFVNETVMQQIKEDLLLGLIVVVQSSHLLSPSDRHRSSDMRALPIECRYHN